MQQTNLYEWYGKLYEMTLHIANKEKAGTSSDPSKSIRLLCEQLRASRPKDFRKLYLVIIFSEFIALRNHLEHKPQQKLPKHLYLFIVLDVLPNFTDCVVGLYPELVNYCPIITTFLHHVVSVDSQKN